MPAVAAGREPGGLFRDPAAAACVELPNMARERNTQGISLEEFRHDPLLRRRLTEFPFHAGQPPEIRQAFERAIGIR